MIVDIKASLLGQLVLKLAQIATGEIHHRPAVSADEVVVVLGGSPQQVAVATPLGMHLADKSQFSEDVQRAIDGDAPDTGMLLVHFFIDRCWGEVLMAESNGIDDLPPLRGELVPPLPQ